MHVIDWLVCNLEVLVCVTGAYLRPRMHSMKAGCLVHVESRGALQQGEGAPQWRPD